MGGAEQALCSSTSSSHARPLPQTGAVLWLTGADVLLVEGKSRDSSGYLCLWLKKDLHPLS